MPMRKIFIAIVVVISVFTLTAFFYITPENLLLIINNYLPELTINQEGGEGNLITGYSYDRVSVVKKGEELIGVNKLKVQFNYLPLITGKVAVRIKSNEVKGYVNVFFNGKMDGELSIKELHFHTSSFGISDKIDFSALLTGVLKLRKESVLLEIKTEEIHWQRLTVSDIDIPFTLFTMATGGIVFTQKGVQIKSINFAGEKGNARLIGEINKDGRKLVLEIIPKNWDEPYLLPLIQYKVEPGLYKIPLTI